MIELHKRTIWSFVAVAFLALAVSAVPVLAQVETPPGAMPANDAFGTATADAEQMDQDALMQLVQGVEDPLFGVLEDNNGEYSGEYISFSADQQSGAISQYSMMKDGQEMPVFTEISAEGFQPSEMNVSGPLFTATDNEFTIFAHDNPYGTMHMVGDGTVNLTLAEGFSAVPMQPDNPNTQAWMLTSENASGVLVVYNGTVESNVAGGEGGGEGIMDQITNWFEGLFGGGGEDSGSSEQSSEPKYMNVVLPAEGALVYRGLPINDAFPRTDELGLARHLANWTVEGEMAIMTADSTTLWYTTESGIMQADVQATPGSRVAVNLTPPEEVPSTLANASSQMYYVIAMDTNTMDMANGTPTVMVNGEEMTEAQSMDELSGGSSYFMYEGTNAAKLVVPLPMNMTTDPVSITVEMEQTNSSVAMASPEASAAAMPLAGLGAIALIGLAGAVMVVRRKK